MSAVLGNDKKCPWCGWTPECVDARKLVGCEGEIKTWFDEGHPYVMRCDNAMCNVQPSTTGSATREWARFKWNNMQSAASIGLEYES